MIKKDRSLCWGWKLSFLEVCCYYSRLLYLLIGGGNGAIGTPESVFIFCQAWGTFSYANECWFSHSLLLMTGRCGLSWAKQTKITKETLWIVIFFFFCSVLFWFFPKLLFSTQAKQHQPVNINSGSCRLRKHTGRRPWLVTQIRTQMIPEQVRWGCVDTDNSSCLFSHVRIPRSGSA